jgi:DNA-binding transcriptional regulator YiaG
LAIEQRTTHTSRRHIPTNRIHRKAIPTTPKTLGDHIRIKRYEKRLTMSQAAVMAEVTLAALQSFEQDAELPNELQWQTLERLLGLDPRLKPTKSNR